MGIENLLKALKSITKQKNISEYANLRVAVDTYCWLHKAIFTCAHDLANGKETDEYIQYCLKRVEMLQQHNITPVMVFDGGHLPSKKGTEAEREKKRNDSRLKAKEYQLQGDREKAMAKFAESIDITPLMASKLMNALKTKKIECIVAPYEADAQLAYLSEISYVDIIITEDSDLLAYGAKRVFFKMDKNGNGDEISLSELENCKEYNFQRWSHNQFLTLCIMAGCDYLDSIPGVGLKTAYQSVSGCTNYKQAIDYFQRKQKFKVPYDYVEQFEKAFLTFRFQQVFCPVQRKCVTLHEVTENDIVYPSMNTDDLGFLGVQYSDDIAQRIADGELCPQTLSAYESTVSSKSSQLPFDKPLYGRNTDVQVFRFIKKDNSQNNQKGQSTQKLTIKFKQQNLNSYFKPTMKPFKPPSRKEFNIEEEVQQLPLQEIQTNQSQLQEEKIESQIVEEPQPQLSECDQYSISEEQSNDSYKQQRTYQEFGNYLFRQIQFNKFIPNF